MTDAVKPWEGLAGRATRLPRSVDTREQSQRKTTWTPSAILPDPTPRDGFVFKWVRVSAREKPDKANFQKRLREGWEPVNAEDHPELMLELGIDSVGGRVEVGGLILCKTTAEMVRQRSDYYLGRTNAEMEAAEQTYMRDEDERMKKINDNKRKVVFGQTAR